MPRQLVGRIRCAAVELVPKALIVGAAAAVTPMPGTPVVTEEKINRIWAEVAPREGYRQLQILAEGTAAQFVGRTPDDGATIQLPLVQARSAISVSVHSAGEECQFVLKTIARHLGVAQFYNLGLKLIYHAPVADRDARAFLLRHVLRKREEDLVELQRGGEPFWAGVKFFSPSADGSFYIVVIEPWVADSTFLYIDVDAQFPAVANLDTVTEKVREAQDFISTSVAGYLDKSSGAL